MKNLNSIIAAVAVSGAIITGGTMVVQAENTPTNDALTTASAAITLEQAIGMAQKSVSGTPTKAEFSTDEGMAVWEIEIVNANRQVFDIEVDATSGKILKQQADKIDHEDEDEDANKDDED